MGNFGIQSCVLFLLIAGVAVNSQYFDPNLDDKAYLDHLELEVSAEVDDAKHELVGQAKLIEDVTKTFIGAKLKENLFKALRFLAEHDDNKTLFLEKQRREGKDDGEADEDGETKTTQKTVGSGGVTVASATSAPISGLIPRVANIIKTLFGGADRVNFTSYAEAATKYLPDSVGNQVVGVVKLLQHSPEAVAASRTRSYTPIPTTVVYLTSEETKPPSVTTEQPKVASTSTTSTVEVDEEEEDENSKSRQLRLPDLSGGLSILGAFLGGTAESRTSTAKPAAKGPAKATTESASGFEEETTSNSANLANFANDVRNGLGDLIKVVPDLFKGAREGVSLITALRGLFGSFGGER